MDPMDKSAWFKTGQEGGQSPPVLSPADKSRVLQQLARIIRRVENRAEPPAGAVATGWAPVDEALCDRSADPPLVGLRLGSVHEFLGPAGGDRGDPLAAASVGPACLLVHLAGRAADAMEGAFVVWVGRRVWPSPQFLAGAGLLERSLFVDADAGPLRLWAMELAMRSPAVAAVIGDGQGLSARGKKMPATRRLELAGRTSRCLTLLALPGDERASPSAAMTRWRVQSAVSDSLRPAWWLELLRWKGNQAALLKGRRWMLEWDGAQGAVIVSAPLVGGLPEAPSASFAGSGEKRTG